MLPADAGTLLLEDLNKSGLRPEDLGAYPAQETELAAIGIRPHMYLDNPGIGTPGYVIPYYDINGVRAPFYRVRLFRPLPKGARYLQPQGSGSWVYFPTSFPGLLKDTLNGKGKSCVNGFEPALMICEGEKKAAKACSDGFLCCGLGGVYNWRTKVMELPEGTTIFKGKENQLFARMTGEMENPPTNDKRAVLAAGLINIIELARTRQMQVVIVFDTDVPENNNVQKAAAELGFELRAKGVPMHRIRQLVLPSAGKKVGLDDYLLSVGVSGLQSLLHKTLESRSAFPRHPDLKGFVNHRMGNGQVSRTEAKELSLLLLSDMDSNGMRMIEESTGQPYYFDSRSKHLLRVNLLHHHSEPLHESQFGGYLYRHYDIGQADSRLLPWLASGFTGEQPLEQVSPRSVITQLSRDRIAYQVDDGHFALVSADAEVPVVIMENGNEGVMFRSDQVENLDVPKMLRAFARHMAALKNPRFETLMWPQALSQFKFCRPGDYKILAVLCYLSPWLLRWKGTQLPVELMIGEPGSGKSSLYSLRLLILTGRAALRNQPTDVRDWYSSITSQDGLHVTDNVHFASKEIRQRLSDEICRIVTEPSPYVEMRKLFTTNENMRIPVRTCFALTAITQPFTQADILQRSMIFELAAIGEKHSSGWPHHQIDGRGGREEWIGHHLAVLHMFLRAAREVWDPAQVSQHRLANFEQIFQIMSGVLGVDNAGEVIDNLVATSEEQISEYDWTMEALKQFCAVSLPTLQRDPRKLITMQEVSTWAMSKEEFQDNAIVTNSRRLSRYIHSHAFMVEKCTGLFKVPGKVGNREAYRIKHI